MSNSRLKDGSSDNCSSLGAMGYLLRKLNELLETEYGKSIIRESFRNHVDSIYDKLKKLSEVDDPPRTVNYWMKDVRELSYDMADFVNGLVDAPHAEAKVDEISEFEAEVVDAIERYDCYNLEIFLKKDSNTEVKLGTRSVFPETELVGMDDQIMKLRSGVLGKGNNKEDSQLKVVSILSVSQGVGKSMLAQKLWRDELETGLSKENGLERQSCRAFVLLAKKPDMRMILRSILSQVHPHEQPGDYTVPNLIHDIRTHLQNKRYFIVIDDLWDTSVWDIVRRAFPNGKKCSRIIITTTVEKVAHACCSDRYNIIHINPLSDGQANKLFFSRIIGPGKEYPQKLNVISDVTRKCDGLPLAIICIATLVASQQEIKQKLDTKKMEQQLNYVKNFLDNNLRTSPTSVEILNQALKLCYSGLPHCLKTCLLFLSMYPENYIIIKEDLVKQWIAEGFIVEGKSVEKIAGRYFDVLVSLGLIQRIDFDCRKQQHHKKKNGEDNDDDKEEEKEEEGLEVEVEEEEEPLQHSKRVSYVVHPTVFEFITCKSMEDNFITIVDYAQSKLVPTERIHRLSLHFGSATYATTPTSIRLSQVRSLAFMGLLNCMPSLLEFKAVRVMILHIRSDDRDKRFSLKEINKLDLLRYLQVRCNVTVELPEQVQCLKHLKTLEINAGVADVPPAIVDHSTLQHVRIGKKTEYKNLAQGHVTSTKPDISDVLRSKHLPDIEVFELLPPVCIFSSLPLWIRQLTSLRFLELVVRELGKYELDHLGILPVLTVLSLYVRKPNRGVVTFHTEASSFPALKYFKLVSGVLFLRFPQNAMPKLLRLKICFNAHRGDNYSHILVDIQHLENLKEVVASIGVATGAEEADYIAAKSALQDTIGKHSEAKFTNGKRLLDPVDEEYDRPVRQVIESSSKWDEALNKQSDMQKEDYNDSPTFVKGERLVDPVDEEHDPPEIQEIQDQEIDSSNIDMQKEALPMQQPGTSGKLPTPDISGVISPPPWRQSHNKIWRRPGPTRGDGDIMVGTLPVFVCLLVGKLRALKEQEHHELSIMNDRGIRRKISSLLQELSIMNDAIIRYNPLDHYDNDTRRWFYDVRELSYDIEDWADLFALRVTSHFWDNPDELRDLEYRALVLSHVRPWRFRRYNPAVARPARHPLFTLHNPASFLDGPTEEVIMLMNVMCMAELKTISIVGMAGSGKTTLAAAVYQRLQQDFVTSVFISVGPKRNMVINTLNNMLSQLEMGKQGSRDIFSQIEMELQRSEDMLWQLEIEQPRSEDIELLTWKLRESLKKKRYLIVVDDLWSREHWEIIKSCFPEDNLHSRIIITTRNDALALHCSLGSSDCIYKIGLLSDADSKQLLLDKVLGNRNDCPPYLEDIYAQTMKRCGGLPLAIVSVAAMLAQVESKDEWWRNGFTMLSSPDANYLMHRLYLSYNDLPPNLKICMLYLSIFPEYYEVDVELLVRLWIAEAFIVEESGRTMEETARSYLGGLISRNMVLLLHMNHDGIPKCCMVHPVIHGFIVYKSREENFITIVNDEHQDTANRYGNINRRSVQISREQDRYMEQIGSRNLSHAHSVIVIGQASKVPHLSDLRVVRVLHLEGCDGKVCLDGLHELQLLRYLSLRGTDVSKLPEKIGELSCLQTLDVRSTNVKKLPTRIVSLEKLMHLLCGSAKLPCGIAKMRALRTLSCAIVMNSTTSIIQELIQLIDLRELELFYDFTETPGNDRLVKFPGDGFQRLKKLRIQCGSASITFEPAVLPSVEILELSFEGLLDEESTGVSGIEHLLSLKHVLLEFSQDDAGAMVMVDAVRKAAATVHPNRPVVTVNVDGRRPLGSTAT